jgi:CHAT domain-containing protein
VVHLATHGQFSSQADDTFILTWDNRLNAKELDTLLRVTDQSRPNAIELLVLSACQTATGDKRAALGLAGVAVRAGARSTLASLWSIDDKSSALLMSQFYRELVRTEVTKAEALRLAQLSLLQNPRYQHPRYWAPFVLVGNWL